MEEQQRKEKAKKISGGGIGRSSRNKEAQGKSMGES